MEWVDVLEQDGYTDKDVAKLIAAVRVSEQVIRKVEYGSVDIETGKFTCPVCDWKRREGHHDGCSLNQALAQLQSSEFGEVDV